MARLFPRRPLTGALAPLNDAVFVMLWSAWFAANMTMWSNDVAAAWLMTQLTDQVMLVALVQSASTLPVFLLGLPSGALADIVDRRRYLAFTQLWVALIALVLAGLSLLGMLTAQGLLLLTFANGIGLAMRWPVFSAIVADVVPKDRLPAALSLNVVGMNISRVVGPVVAGALLAAWGASAVFALNAVLALVSFSLILRWRSESRASTLPGERFFGAMRVGVQHVWQSPPLRILMMRVFLLFFQVAALTALMPLLARRFGFGAGGYTMLLACMGMGAIVGALNVNRLRQRFRLDQIVRAGVLLQALASLGMAFVPDLWLGCLVMLCMGAAWVITVNSYMIAAQLSLPDWVRARGMSIFQMALMGGSACGAAAWGQVAHWSDVSSSQAVAGVFGLFCLALAWRDRLHGVEEVDLSPVRLDQMPPPVIAVAADDGPVMVTVDYRIDPTRAQEFAAVMQATRAARLRQGALSWGLFRDTEEPGRYIEYFVDDSWVDHLRRQERFTAADDQLREQRHAFHRGPEAPKVKRFVAETLRRP